MRKLNKKKKTKVLLINPAESTVELSMCPPFGLGMIASFLEANGVEVSIFDEQAGERNVEKHLKEFQPDIVGITATTPVAPRAYQIAKITRELGILTVMGGKHASALPQEAARNVDVVVVGEGEKAMLDIVRGRREKIIYGTDFIKNIDDIPPYWHFFNMEFYVGGRNRSPRGSMYFLPAGTRVGSLFTSRGCPFNCIFCYNSWKGSPVRYQSPKRVIADIELLVKKYKINGLLFMDDNFFYPHKRLIEICERMIEKKFNLLWGCQTRADSITLETLKLAHRAGLRSILFGFESGSQRILTMLKGKGPTIEKNCEAIRLCWEAGVGPLGSFMVGSPTETIEDLEKTLAFIRSHKFDHVGVHITTPFPGTALWDWCLKKKIIPPDIDYSALKMSNKNTFYCNDTIPPEVIREYRDKMDYLGSPLTFSHILDRLRYNPQLLFQAIKNPRESLRYVMISLKSKLKFLWGRRQ